VCWTTGLILGGCCGKRKKVCRGDAAPAGLVSCYKEDAPELKTASRYREGNRALVPVSHLAPFAAPATVEPRLNKKQGSLYVASSTLSVPAPICVSWYLKDPVPQSRYPAFPKSFQISSVSSSHYTAAISIKDIVRATAKSLNGRLRPTQF
jgi:hypothetical protein